MPDNAQQRPMFDVRQFIPNPYPADSIYALIDRFGHLIIQQDDCPPPAAPGQEPRDRVILTKLVVLMKTSG